MERRLKRLKTNAYWNWSTWRMYKQNLRILQTEILDKQGWEADKPVLEINNLDVFFNTRSGIVKAVKNASFAVNEGDFYGIVGESGSGKSTLGKTILRMIKPSEGTILFNSKLISQQTMSKIDRKWFHKNAQMIFQDPGTSINPVKSILSIVSEPLKINGQIGLKTWTKIKEINLIKNFYKLDYNNFLSTIYWKNLNAFWNESLACDQQFLNFLNALNLDLSKDFYHLLEYVSEHMIDYQHSKRINLNVLTKTAQAQSDFFKVKLDQIARNDVDDIDVQIQDTKQEIAHLSQITNYSPMWIKTAADLKLAYWHLLKFSHKRHRVYELTNKTLKRNIINKAQSAWLINKQEAVLETRDFLKQAQHHMEVAYYHDKLLLLKTFYDLKFLKASEILEINELINTALKDKYETNFLELKKFKKDSLRASLNDQIDFFKNFVHQHKVKRLFLYVKLTSSAKIFHKIFGADNVNSAHLLKRYNHYDSQNEAEAKWILDEVNFKFYPRIQAYKKILKNEAKSFANNNPNLDNLVQKLKLAKQKLQKLQKARKQLIRKIQHERKQTNSFAKTREIWSKLDLSWKLDQKIGRKLLELFVKKAWSDAQQKPLCFKWFYFIKTFVGSGGFWPKWSNRKVVSFQYKKVLRLINLYKLLFYLPNWLSYFLFFVIKKALILNAVYQALIDVGLKPDFAHRYPHEFSGGQRQRIVIARALINQPKLIVADEAISALDVSVQSQVMKIMINLAKEKGITFLFIVHDLSMVRYACNQMIIMHQGQIVEKGDVSEVFTNPQHIYTKSLLRAIPELSSIDKNLANVNEENLLYATYYNDANQPRFIKVANDKNHEVYATDFDLEKWNNVPKNGLQLEKTQKN